MQNPIRRYSFEDLFTLPMPTISINNAQRKEEKKEKTSHGTATNEALLHQIDYSYHTHTPAYISVRRSLGKHSTVDTLFGFFKSDVSTHNILLFEETSLDIIYMIPKSAIINVCFPE